MENKLMELENGFKFGFSVEEDDEIVLVDKDQFLELLNYNLGKLTQYDGDDSYRQRALGSLKDLESLGESIMSLTAKCRELMEKPYEEK